LLPHASKTESDNSTAGTHTIVNVTKIRALAEGKRSTDDPALKGYVPLQEERLLSLTRLQHNCKKASAFRKTESYYGNKSVCVRDES